MTWDYFIWRIYKHYKFIFLDFSVRYTKLMSVWLTHISPHSTVNHILEPTFKYEYSYLSSMHSSVLCTSGKVCQFSQFTPSEWTPSCDGVFHENICYPKCFCLAFLWHLSIAHFSELLLSPITWSYSFLIKNHCNIILSPWQSLQHN